MNGLWATASHTAAGIDLDVAPIPFGAALQVTLAAAVMFVVDAATDSPEAVFEFRPAGDPYRMKEARARGGALLPTT